MAVAGLAQGISNKLEGTFFDLRDDGQGGLERHVGSVEQRFGEDLAHSLTSNVLTEGVKAAVWGDDYQWSRTSALSLFSDSFGTAIGGATQTWLEERQDPVRKLGNRFGIDSRDPHNRKTLETAISILGSRESSVDLRRSTTRDLVRLSGASAEQTEEIMGLYEKHVFANEEYYFGSVGDLDVDPGSNAGPTGIDESIGTVIYITQGYFKEAIPSPSGNGIIDDTLIGAGKLSAYVVDNILERPYLKYGLMALDVATGPVAFALREGVMATAVGDFISGAQAKLLDSVQARFEDAGRTETDAVYGAGGAFSIVGVALGGATGLVKRLDDVGYSDRIGEAKLIVGSVEEYGVAKAKTGDGTIHRDHQPSKAALLARAEELKGDALTPAERRRIINGGASVNVPANVHRAGPTYGGKNTRALINSDKSDLATAASRDADLMVENARKLAPEHVGILEESSKVIKQRTNSDYDSWLKRQIDDD